MDETTTTGGRIMATEAQNIMQGFRAADEKERVKEENRLLFGGDNYVGGVPGFITDVAAGMYAGTTAVNSVKAIENLTDPRDFKEMTADYLEELAIDPSFMKQFKENLAKSYREAVVLASDKLRVNISDLNLNLKKS